LVNEQENQQLQEAVDKATKALRSRSYSGRHPELGKMIKCAACGRRHYDFKICEITYAKDADGNEIVNPWGARSNIRGRFHPHPSKRKLQLVQRTQKVFYEYQPYFKDAHDCMVEARTEAGRQLKAERKAESKRIRHQQKHSRRINLGLAAPGTRP
jgi:hypothetical protein